MRAEATSSKLYVSQSAAQSKRRLFGTCMITIHYVITFIIILIMMIIILMIMIIVMI